MSKTFPVRKIAVLRANALGDFIFALPALTALRQKYPAAEITYLGLEWHKNYLENRPCPIDRVVVIPNIPGLSTDGKGDKARTIEGFFEKMRAEHFDLAVQLHGGGKNSNPFIKKIDARFTIGSRTPDAIPLDVDIPHDYFHHEVIRFLEVVELAGATTKEIEPKLLPTKKDVDEAQKIVGSINIRKTIILHPGASDPRRRWPAESFAEVGDYFYRQGFKIFITGNKDELPLAVETAKFMRGVPKVVAGKLSLEGLTGLLAKSTLLISNDTGPLHLSRALGTRTVGIYWCFNVINAGPINYEKHRAAISWQTKCDVCGALNIEKRCSHNNSFVAEISPKEVTLAAAELLGFKKGTFVRPPVLKTMPFPLRSRLPSRQNSNRKM